MKPLRAWRSAAVVGAVATLSLAGCRGGSDVRCEPSARYTSVGSVGPVRIPDDLTPPDESDALQLPPPSAADNAAAPPPGGCLEEPPKFSRDNGGQTPPAAAPAQPAPPPSPDREISN